MSKLQVLLVFGGQSTEHEVSLQSAHNVYAALDDSKYDVTLCYIDKVGRWWLTEDIEGSYVGHPRLLPDLGKKQFLIEPEGKTISPDVIFPVLHGKNGEDGSVQGLLELLHVPYVGPSVLSAAITMDKDVTKRLVQEEGIPVVPWVLWRTSDHKPTFESVAEKFGMPLFVKPCNAGSSVGVSKVENKSDWHSALERAATYDDKVLIEKSINAREIELAVLGNVSPKVSGAGEVVAGEEFYTYDAKYAKTSTSSTNVPAENISEDTLIQLQKYALQAYAVTQGRGMARVDFFIDRVNGAIYLNEINSIPGFTNISMYPKLWHGVGMTYGLLIDTLIDLAVSV